MGYNNENAIIISTGFGGYVLFYGGVRSPQKTGFRGIRTKLPIWGVRLQTGVLDS